MQIQTGILPLLQSPGVGGMLPEMQLKKVGKVQTKGVAAPTVGQTPRRLVGRPPLSASIACSHLWL